MVVLVNGVVTLLGKDLLGGIVLVIGIDVPTLDAGHDIMPGTEVPLALEVAVLQEVLLDITVRNAPLRLEGKVGKTESIDGKTVTVDKDAGVGSHGIAIGVVEAVSVVERSAVARVAETLIADERVGTIVEAEGRVADVALETNTVGCEAVGTDHGTGSVGTGLDLDGVARLGRKGGGVEAHPLTAAAAVDRRGGDVLDRKGSAVANQLHIAADITAAKDDAALMYTLGGQMGDGYRYLIIHPSWNSLRGHNKACCRFYCNILCQPLCLNLKCRLCTCAFNNHSTRHYCL